MVNSARLGLAGWLRLTNRRRRVNRRAQPALRRPPAAGYGDFFVRANVNAMPLYRALGYREFKAGEMVVAGGIALPVLFMDKLS